MSGDSDADQPGDSHIDGPANAGARECIELATIFLRLGITAFGGPAAHIALMKEEVVSRRKWLSDAEFVDLLGATNLIPGPNSTEMAIHIGFLRGRWIGLVVAGACFILPSALIVTALASAYVRLGVRPEVQSLLSGVKPVIIAIVLQAIAGLIRVAVKTRWMALLGIGALALALFGVDEVAVLFGAGLITGMLHWFSHSEPEGRRMKPLLALLAATTAIVSLPALLSSLPSAINASGTRLPFNNGALFLFFLKVGSVLYGSGYVLIAFLRDGLVSRWGWLTSAQLLDAVAVGQLTPGPVFTTATFIGYILGGPMGAVAATVGIFLPSFLFVAVSGPLIPRIRSSATAGSFLDGVNVAALALMAAVTIQLGRAAISSPSTAAIAGASAILLIRFRVNAVWLILGGALLGFATHVVR